MVDTYDGDDDKYMLPLPQGHTFHGPPSADLPSNRPIAIGTSSPYPPLASPPLLLFFVFVVPFIFIGKKEGPHLSEEELTSIITRLAKGHGDANYSIRARVFTNHGIIKHLWGGINYTVGDGREVHLVLLSGEFTFKRRNLVSHVNHMQMEIDAVDGNVLTFGHTEEFKPFYDDPSLLDAFSVSQ